MNTQEAILSRRSVRKYSAAEISDTDIQEIIEAGLYAPSALNLQPWYYVVLKSEEARQKMLEVMAEVSRDIEPELQGRFGKHPEVVKETLGFIRLLGGAPVYILVFQLNESYTMTDASIDQSIGAGIENILVAAAGKGIGSCWLTAPVEVGMGDRLRDMFAPGKGTLKAVLTLGYAERTPKAPARRDGRFCIM